MNEKDKAKWNGENDVLTEQIIGCDSLQFKRKHRVYRPVS